MLCTELNPIKLLKIISKYVQKIITILTKNQATCSQLAHKALDVWIFLQKGA